MTLLITDGLPRGLGYVEIDQRNVHAPLPAGVQRHFQSDTYTCTHCSVVVVLNLERKRERYKCKGCDHHICDPCAANMTLPGAVCKTMKQKYEEHLERETRRIATGLILP